MVYASRAAHDANVQDNRSPKEAVNKRSVGVVLDLAWCADLLDRKIDIFREAPDCATSFRQGGTAFEDQGRYVLVLKFEQALQSQQTQKSFSAIVFATPSAAPVAPKSACLSSLNEKSQR